MFEHSSLLLIWGYQAITCYYKHIQQLLHSKLYEMLVKMVTCKETRTLSYFSSRGWTSIAWKMYIGGIKMFQMLTSLLFCDSGLFLGLIFEEEANG